MSVNIEWNPNWERDFKREIVKNLTPKYRTALARVTCPEHGRHPTIQTQPWQIRGCCEKAVELATKAIRKVNAAQ